MKMLIHVVEQPTKVILNGMMKDWLLTSKIVCLQDFIHHNDVFIMRELVESDFHSGYLVLRLLAIILQKKGIYLFSSRKFDVKLREGQENRISNWQVIFESLELLGYGKDEQFKTNILSRRGEYISAILQDICKIDMDKIL